MNTTHIAFTPTLGITKETHNLFSDIKVTAHIDTSIRAKEKNKNKKVTERLKPCNRVKKAIVKTSKE